MRSDDESENPPTKKDSEDVVPEASHTVPTHLIRSKSKIPIEAEAKKVLPNRKNLAETHTTDLPNTKKEPEKEFDEVSREKPGVTWSTKKKEIADRVEKISSKFEEIQRAIRPAENISSSDSNDTILDSRSKQNH